MQIHGLKTCDTCRKARKTLPDAQFLDIREEPVPESVLALALEKFGTALVNTRSTTWREMSAAERDLPALEQIRAHPTVMKRPLIVAGDQMYLGWTKAVQESLADSVSS